MVKSCQIDEWSVIAMVIVHVLQRAYIRDSIRTQFLVIIFIVKGHTGSIIYARWIQWGLEYRTCLVFEWSMAFGSWSRVFEIRTKILRLA